jgi:hypothetical protein
LIGHGSEGEKTNLSINLFLLEKLLNSIPEHADKALGWESDVLWDGQEVVNLLDRVNLALADKLVAHSKGWSGSSDEKSVVEESVKTTDVGGFALNNKSFVLLPELLTGEGSDKADDKTVFHHDLVHIKRVVLGLGLTENLDDITERLLHSLNALLQAQLLEFSWGIDLVVLLRGRGRRGG